MNAGTKRLHPVVESGLDAHRRNTFVLLSEGKTLSLIQAGLFSVSEPNDEDFTGAPVTLLRSSCSKVLRCLVGLFVPVIFFCGFLKNSFENLIT